MSELRARRKAMGISQQRLAELARCSVAMVRLLESGYQPKPSQVLDRIEAVLRQGSKGPSEIAEDALAVFNAFDAQVERAKAKGHPIFNRDFKPPLSAL